jgi:hypothetical protein
VERSGVAAIAERRQPQEVPVSTGRLTRTEDDWLKRTTPGCTKGSSTDGARGLRSDHNRGDCPRSRGPGVISAIRAARMAAIVAAVVVLAGAADVAPTPTASASGSSTAVRASTPGPSTPGEDGGLPLLDLLGSFAAMCVGMAIFLGLLAGQRVRRPTPEHVGRRPASEVRERWHVDGPPPPNTPPDEAHIPRWRRPSVQAARKAR